MHFSLRWLWGLNPWERARARAFARAGTLMRRSHTFFATGESFPQSLLRFFLALSRSIITTLRKQRPLSVPPRFAHFIAVPSKAARRTLSLSARCLKVSFLGADSAVCMPKRMKPPITINETNNLFILDPPFEK
jgi:hypothetical protein